LWSNPATSQASLHGLDSGLSHRSQRMRPWLKKVPDGSLYPPADGILPTRSDDLLGHAKMKTMKPGIVVMAAGAALVGLVVPAAPAADRPADKAALRSKVSIFMRAKLVNSKDVLEGLATEKYDLIESGAERMIVMSKAAEWRVGGESTYTQDTLEFVNAAKELIRQAKAKNIEGATLGYLQLTMDCVVCHKHVRAAKLSSRETIPLSLHEEHAISTAELARLLRAR
jgi:hypothetical protein